MAQHPPKSPIPNQIDDEEARGLRPSPQTDPTNPVNQESTGEWVAAENASENRENEPGLANRDRDERTPPA